MLQLKEEGRTKDAAIILSIMSSTEDGTITTQPYTSDEALALLLDCKLSQRDYQIIRNGALDRGIKLYPTYHDVLASKEACIPSPICVSDYSAEVPIQQLLDHTSKCIFESERLRIVEEKGSGI